MSKNFELLQRIAKNEYFPLPEAPASTPAPQKPRAAMPVGKSPPDPEITKLVQRLFLQPTAGGGPKIVAFIGISREDRSSWICARAAQELAERAGGSVCLVEANLFLPRLHAHLGAANYNGLAEALCTKDPIQSFAIPLGGGNLWLIPSGIVKPGPFPSMDRYRERFAELREAFDHVLVSAPSCSRESDATLIGQLSDGVVLIVDANLSRRESVRRAKEQLDSAHVKLLGAVLDQRTFPIPEKLYRRL